jgi:uncharacterized membrane protein
MNRKMIEHEGRRWTEQGIITTAQYEQIVRLYSHKSHAIGIVPFLGSILVGLGILSFMAANWKEIPDIVRLLIIMAALIGFYFSGEAYLKKGHEKLGIAMIGIGLVTFGAGIILIAQMFHLEAYDVTSWIVWGTTGIVLTYMYRSRYLYMISLLIFSITQFYSVSEFHHFSYVSFAIMLIGLGIYAWKLRSPLLVWLFSISFIAQAIMLITVSEWKFLWVFVPIMLLYVLGDGIKQRDLAPPLQSVSLIAAYTFDLFIILFAEEVHPTDIQAQAASFLTISGVLLAVSMLLKIRSKRGISGAEWIVMPLLLYINTYTDVIYLLILFFFSLFVLWRGYAEGWRFKINLGTVLFLIITMTAYGKLAWSFMDKSFFFIIGGILLLILSWFLNRRRHQFLEQAKEGSDHV